MEWYTTSSETGFPLTATHEMAVNLTYVLSAILHREHMLPLAVPLLESGEERLY